MYINKDESIKKLTAIFLAVIMIFGSILVFPALPVSAAEAAAEEEEEIVIDDFTTIVYDTLDDKLATMTMVFEKNGYELWYHDVTGEMAVKNKATGQVLTSNPYDVASSTTTSEPTKMKLLSQVIIKYNDNDKEFDFNTYRDAAKYKQIKMKKIKGGIRVEYTIGKEEKRKLVPRMIEQSSFETNILQLITNQLEHDKLTAYYSLKDASDPTLSEKARKELQVAFPITKYMAVYVIDPDASNRELTLLETYIKKNTKYTFEMMDEDHQKVDYVPKDKAPPLFKMALEYYIDEDGLYVRLPANGIVFDESTYKLSYISVLPYMGALSREFNGYTFIPDGSGAIIRNEDIQDRTFTLTNKIYGPDYSFFKTGNKMQKWRMPVYGAVQTQILGHKVEKEVITEGYEDPVTGEYVQPVTSTVTELEKEKRTDGFIAIIEEGDAMAEITVDCGAALHKYNSTWPMFTPRPTDQYNLDAATTGLSSLIMVSARRKYAGNYIIRYRMLTGDKANYMGMAEAYRNYLIKRGDLEKIQEESKDIPLYLETFGMFQTAERVFGFPAFLDTMLTTFDNNKQIIDDLNAEDISNIQVRLTGWMNDGLYTLAPTKIKFEKKLGGKAGLIDLVSYANSKGATIYPDINLAVSKYDAPFDGFNYKKDAVRMMDNTIAAERNYFFLTQSFTRFDSGMLISSNVIQSVYDKAMVKYASLEVGAISVASLGAQLHSDQNKKKLKNREESKQIIQDLFAKIKEENNKVMIDAGNAYTYKYVDTILNVDLDSSRFLNESNSIPFMAIVTHGYIDIAGSPINMAGDFDFELLKTIESASNPYFILTYQNSNRLKESWNMYNKYYSVDYKTWLPEIISTYKTLNDALKDIRTKTIVNHQFLTNDGNIVKVTYENGISFILNYNNFEVEAEGHVLAPLGFVKIK